ncbi:MAG: hypothetical protein LC785_05170 [Acidobacteria bacterium]|nr:hypothetical protein [Acidobacteriota bacterium]
MKRSTPLLRNAVHTTGASGRASLRKTVKVFRAGSYRGLKSSARVALCLSLLAQGFFLSGAPSAIAQTKTLRNKIELSGVKPVAPGGTVAVQGGAQGEDFKISSIEPTSSAVVNFAALGLRPSRRLRPVQQPLDHGHRE